MFLLPLLSLLAVPLSVLAAKQSPHDTLVKLAAANNGVIRLNAEVFDLLTTPTRDWTSSIQFTALDKKRRCAPCKEFDPAFASVAKAWTNAPQAERDNHFFATIDFDEGPTVFQKLGLQSAPVVWNYPATEGPRRPGNGKSTPTAYDFSNGFGAEQLAHQLSAHTPVPIPYRAPINWAAWVTFGSSLLAFALTIRFFAPILRSRWTWAIFTVSVVLIMTSGYMFTQIRGMPMTAANGQWIAGGFQSQYGQEVYVVSALYGLLSIAFLMLILVTPLQTDPTRQKVQFYLWTIVIWILFSVLVSFFKMKNRGYPFRILLP
ncbi:oligosaccharyl transferase subunit OST3/OST6 family [Stereum hirsutum FP-91666 SS1]|uniref:oligosaccharyl transferase subunit OST3/OST6 family n=1 Tax=Stereum hirsutum (strain FP-91666) TaxID=721885 RepID=UPI000440F0DE|nr:oligosaccharyl transferase subunit OST3/OST6 family [Stereum hirsutum FP-91666 SS1]EIM90055.1 oligosaccharyl transferase subunit OST3/OST6 family [Stereum hirsutum FP-91666 SS1]